MTERLLLLSRVDCGLCEELEAELRDHPRFAQIELRIEDIDAQPDWQRRYGLRVPVLLDAWNEVVCEGRFDAIAFEQWCDERRRAAR